MTRFADLSDESQLAELNEHLADHSYVAGVRPSQADQEVLRAVNASGALVASSGALDRYPHLRRWHAHISSFPADQQGQWPASAANGGAAATTASGGDDLTADDLFGDDDEEEDEEAYRRQQERAAAALKAKVQRDAAKGKSAPVAKSSVVFDVKPWEADTDMAAMEAAVRRIELDGLTWGAAQLVPVAFGVRKLQIIATIIDEKVPSTDVITEEIEGIEDLVQSVEIAAFNKI